MLKTPTPPALWCQAIKRCYNAAAEGIRKHLQPQQVPAGVSGGFGILVLDLKLKIKGAVSKGPKRVPVRLDLNLPQLFQPPGGSRREAKQAAT